MTKFIKPPLHFVCGDKRSFSGRAGPGWHCVKNGICQTVTSWAALRKAGDTFSHGVSRHQTVTSDINFLVTLRGTVHPAPPPPPSPTFTCSCRSFTSFVRSVSIKQCFLPILRILEIPIVDIGLGIKPP